MNFSTVYLVTVESHVTLVASVNASIVISVSNYVTLIVSVNAPVTLAVFIFLPYIGQLKKGSNIFVIFIFVFIPPLS